MTPSQKILAAIKDISEQVRKPSNMREMINGVARVAKIYLNCDSCTIWLFNPDNKRLVLKGASGKHESGIDEHYYSKGEGLTWYIFESGQGCKLARAADNPFWQGKYVNQIYPDRKETGGPFLGLPLIAYKKPLGTLAFGTDDPHYIFSADDLAFARIIANQISVGVDDLYARQMQFSLGELNKKRLDFISDFNLELLDKRKLKELCQFTCEKAQQMLKCRSASIFLYNKEGTLERNSIAGPDQHLVPTPEIYRRNQGLVGIAAGTRDKHGELIYYSNARIQPLLQNDPVVKRYYSGYKKAFKKAYGIKESVEQVIAIPLNAPRRTAGVLRVINKVLDGKNELDPDGFNPGDIDWLQIIASLVSNSLVRIKNRIQKDASKAVNNLLSEGRNQDIFNKLAKLIVNTSHSYSVCVIRQIDHQYRNMKIIGSSEPAVPENIRSIRIDDGLTGRTFQSDSHNIIKNLHKDPKNYKFLEWAKSLGLVTTICFPLKSFTGNYNLGTLSVYTKYEFEFEEGNLQDLEGFATQIANIIHQFLEEKEITLLEELTNIVKGNFQLEDLFRKVTTDVPEVTGFDRCRIFLKDQNNFRVWSETPKHRNRFYIPFRAKIIQDLISNPRILFYDDIDEKAASPPIAEITHLLNDVRSLCVVPIKEPHRTDEVHGFMVMATLKSREVSVRGDRRKRFNYDYNERVFQTLSNVLTNAIESHEENTIRQYLQTLVDNIPDLLYLKDPEGRFILINKRQEELLLSHNPIDAHEIIGKTDFDFFPERYAKGYRKVEKKLLKKGEKQEADEEIIYGIQGALEEGKTEFLKTTKVPLQDSFGNISAIGGIGRFVTNMIKHQDELRRANEATRDALRNVMAFYNKFKHNAWKYSQQLLLEIKDDPLSRAKAWIIAAEIFVGTELFSNYLANESIEITDGSKIKLKEVFTYRFKNVLKVIPHIMGINGSEINFLQDPEAEILNCKKLHFQLILVSLMENAYRYSGVENPPAITISNSHSYLTFSNTEANFNGSISKLIKGIRQPKETLKEQFDLQGIGLFTIEKYFYENYQRHIELAYDNRIFTVEMPINVLQP